MTETELQDAILRHALDLQRLSAGEELQADKILRELEAELKQLSQSVNLSEAGRKQINAIIKQAEDLISARYGAVAASVDVLGLTVAVAEQTAAIMGGLATPSAERLASLAASILIEGAPTADWWAKQSEDAQFRFAGAVRQGVVNGETNERIVSRVAGKDGFMEVSRRNARTLVHTSIMTAANDARMAVYRKNFKFAQGVRWLATLDSHTCMRCGSLDGEAWDFDAKPLKGSSVKWQGAPPLHHNCRCVVVPVAKSLNALLGITGIDDQIEGGRQRATRGGPVKNTNFEDFLSRQSPAFIEEVLGKTRAEYFKAGKLTLHDLISGANARPLTLDELRARYNLEK